MDNSSRKPGGPDRSAPSRPRPRHLQLRSGRPAEPDEFVPGFRKVDRAHRLLRRAAVTLDRVAQREDWPVPFSPVRFLVLGHLHRASAFGLMPARLARLLEMKRSSLAHHLDVLEDAGLIERGPRSFGDGRKVAARLTERGLYALWSLGSALERAGLGRPTPR